MSNDADAANVVTQDEDVPQVEDAVEEEEAAAVGLLFELENTAVQGRRIAFDVLRQLVGGKPDLTQALFSRHCLASPPEQYLPPLLDGLGKKDSSADSLVSDVSEGIAISLRDKGIKIEPAVLSLLKGARHSDVQLGALTALSPETAEQLMQKLGLADMGVQLLCSKPVDRQFPTADVWLKLAKMIGVSRGSCTVLATSSTSSKAALTAGMRCVGMPDEFTAFQDLGGADLVIEDLDEEAAKNVMSLVHFVSHW